MARSSKPLYKAHVKVWPPSLERGPIVEDHWVEVEIEGQKRTVRRQRLGLPLDGGKGRVTPASKRPGFYVSPAGIGFDGQGVEIKDREPRKDDERQARIWASR